MEIIIFIIPVITSLILFFKFRKETTPLEYVLVLVPSIFLFFFIKILTVAIETEDTQYTGQYITKVIHYDEWNEWIHQTCYRTAKTGKTTVSIPYDCSYCENHPESWVMMTNTDNEIYISENEFIRLKNKWNTPKVFVEMNRNFYTIDGDAQYYNWNGKRLDSRTITVSSSYSNKVKASNSIFKFDDISDKEAQKLGIYDYPEITEDGDQESILGYRALPESAKKLKFINGYYGKTYQLRTYILVFKNKPYSISEKQRSYWQGGNKNEIIICLGIDSLTQKVQWVNSFSWMDNPILDLKVEDHFLSNNKKPVNLNQFTNWYESKGIKLWKRKEFSDFKYINITLTSGQYLFILLIVLAYNIGISIFVINNEYKN